MEGSEAVIRKAPPKKLNALDPDAACTRIVAACELRFGAQRKDSAPLTQRMEQLLQALTALPPDTPADEHYPDIRAALERSAPPPSAAPIHSSRPMRSGAA